MTESAPKTGTAPVIVAESVSKRVQSPEGLLTILDAVSFEIQPGDTVAIVGPSGSGKSTLLGLLAGLDLPTQGRVQLDGHDLNALDEDGRAAVRARSVGFVFQSFHLLAGLTALENVLLPLELAGHANAKSAAREVLDAVGLGGRLGHYPHQLSGGEQQRVALARAFATGASVLFADEPTGNLDTRTGLTVVDRLFELNASRHTTLVLVTHDESLADRCQRVLQLESGRLVSDTPAAAAS